MAKDAKSARIDIFWLTKINVLSVALIVFSARTNLSVPNAQTQIHSFLMKVSAEAVIRDFSGMSRNANALIALLAVVHARWKQI